MENIKRKELSFGTSAIMSSAFLRLFLFFSISIVSSLTPNFASASEAKTGVIRHRVCAASLLKAINHTRMPRAQRQSILDRNVEEQNRMSAKLQINWTRTMQRLSDPNRGLADGEYFFWMRENGLKEVNKARKSIAFSERYLLMKDRIISEALEKNPSWGTLIHRNFKDRVIISKLKPEELKRLLDGVLEKELNEYLGTTPQAQEHIKHLLDRTTVGTARTFEGAHLKANGFDINSWQKRTTELRSEIEAMLLDMVDGKLPYEILVAVFKHKKTLTSFHPSNVKTALLKVGVNEDLATKASESIFQYINLLQGADMLPTPEMLKATDLAVLESWLKSRSPLTAEIDEIIGRRPWTQRHATFFRKSFNSKAKHIIALDIKGFGIESFVIRDAWIMKGEQRQALPKIYIESTKYLNSFFADIIADVKRDLNIDVIAEFRSGDDALFALGPEITPEKINDLEVYLLKRKNIYFSIATRVSPHDSLGLLIEAARTGVKEEKN